MGLIIILALLALGLSTTEGGLSIHPFGMHMGIGWRLATSEDGSGAIQLWWPNDMGGCEWTTWVSEVEGLSVTNPELADDSRMVAEQLIENEWETNPVVAKLAAACPP